MSPYLGLAVSQNARPARLQAIARGKDVLHLVADMVNAPGGVPLEEGRDR